LIQIFCFFVSGLVIIISLVLLAFGALVAVFFSQWVQFFIGHVSISQLCKAECAIFSHDWIQCKHSNMSFYLRSISCVLYQIHLMIVIPIVLFWINLSVNVATEAWLFGRDSRGKIRSIQVCKHIIIFAAHSKFWVCRRIVKLEKISNETVLDCLSIPLVVHTQFKGQWLIKQCNLVHN